jgi:hypothetical protein
MFNISVKQYSKISKQTLAVFLLFSKSYVCEFGTLAFSKMGVRGRLVCVDFETRDPTSQKRSIITKSMKTDQA